MKTIIIFICICLTSNILLSQTTASPDTGRSDWFEPAPAGFNFVPHGSFIDTAYINDDTVIKTVSVDPFWMSNEVTNREFREFTSYLNTYPDDSLCFIDPKKDQKENAYNNKIDKNKYSICKINKEINRNIIDTITFKKDKPDYINYFINKKYDDFPVTGVSYIGAKYFCIWKSKIESNEYKAVNISYCKYRLPSAEEWKYAVSKVHKEKRNKNAGLQKSISGIKNKLKLYNLSGNVSEWTSSAPGSSPDDKKIVMGGSWKTKSGLYEKTIAKEESQSSSIGFRIVSSYCISCNQKTNQ